MLYGPSFICHAYMIMKWLNYILYSTIVQKQYVNDEAMYVHKMAWL